MKLYRCLMHWVWPLPLCPFACLHCLGGCLVGLPHWVMRLPRWVASLGD